MDVDSIPLLQVMPANDLAACSTLIEQLAADRADLQECHGTADLVLERLGGQAEARRTGWGTFKARLQSDRRGVYRVDLRVPAEDQLGRWDHTFAVLKMGTGVVIYQAFQGAYSLAEWLNGSAGAHAQRYAAASGEALAPERVQEFFLGVERMLARFVDGKEPSWFRACFCGTPDYEEHANGFYDDAVALFGAPPGRRNMYRPVIQAAIKAGSVQVRWTRAPVPE